MVKYREITTETKANDTEANDTEENFKQWCEENAKVIEEIQEQDETKTIIELPEEYTIPYSTWTSKVAYQINTESNVAEAEEKVEAESNVAEEKVNYNKQFIYCPFNWYGPSPEYQPSGCVNISRAREFYITYYDNSNEAVTVEENGVATMEETTSICAKIWRVFKKITNAFLCMVDKNDVPIKQKLSICDSNNSHNNSYSGSNNGIIKIKRKRKNRNKRNRYKNKLKRQNRKKRNRQKNNSSVDMAHVTKMHDMYSDDTM